MAHSQNDFEEGGVIYVRGRKAICKRTDDYPLIFWAYEDNPSVLYHRNLKHDAPMFSIYPPQTDDNESKEIPPTKYTDLQDDQIIVDVTSTAGVHIEKCVQTTFTIEKKVSSIKLIDCKDVTVNFVESDSSCDALRSVDCQLSCQEYGSFSLDDCKNIRIHFPHKVTGDATINVKTTKCKEIQLTAKKSTSSDADITFDIEEKQTGTEESVPIFQTCFEKGEFATKQIEQSSSNESVEVNKESGDDQKTNTTQSKE